MGGPNYLEAAIVAIAAVVMTGVLGGVRAFFHVQQIMTDRTGSALPYQLGRWLRAHLTKKKTPQ